METLRPLRLSDAKSIAKYANNRNVWLTLRDIFPHPYTEADAVSFIGLISKTEPLTTFAIELNGEAVGIAGIHKRDDVFAHTAEIGYWIGEPFWHQGIATRTVAALKELAFKRHNLYRLYAEVFESNPASTKVLVKNGFELEATLKKGVVKDGKLWDFLIYSCINPNFVKD